MGSTNGAENAQREAQAAEDARRVGIANTTAKINQIYDAPARQKQYGDFLGALRDYYTGDVNRQKVVADRNSKFALARGGLVGGSAQIDANRNIGEEYQKGLLSAENRAQSGLTGLKSQDENSRMQLIQLAQSGLDATTASSRALANAGADTRGALADATQKGIGDIFAGTTATYKQQQEAAARRAGQRAPVGSIWGGN
jgi:hypothetical protein